MATTPYLGHTPIECDICGNHDWTQIQDYHATDKHWLTWQPQGTPQYHFTFETTATSDEDTKPWECANGHIANDDLQDVIEAVMAL